MKIIKLLIIPLIVFFTTGFCNFAFGSNVDVNVRNHQTTTSPASARFEVVQSTIAARLTFRLDRYTGRVWELVKNKDDENTWQETPVSQKPQISTPNRPRFQLFTSGLAARHTFLIDTDTGKTWVIVSATQKERDGTEIEYRAWQLFAD